MKKMLTIAFSALLLLWSSCTQEIESRVDDLESRVDKLEELCAQMNANIEALKGIVNALQNQDYITSVTPIEKDGEIIGYTITFSKGNSVKIYPGQNGKDGQDGKDAPIIGIEPGSDGIYYWTLDGEWLLDDNGNKIPAAGQNGQDGVDGADGADGNTPQMKIVDGYWWVSFDNGETWKQLGRADGEDGKNGDSIFQSVDSSNPDFIIFILSDGTEIKIPTWDAFEELYDLCHDINSNIDALKNIAGAIEIEDGATEFEELYENGKLIGYRIVFSRLGEIYIYNGDNGQNGIGGQDGQDGVDGQDGQKYRPLIGIKEDTDGVFYWTLDGEWLLSDDGSKVKAYGEDGIDGEDGKDGLDGEDGKDGLDGQDGQEGPRGKPGIVPEFKIEYGNWYMRVGKDGDWQYMGRATGPSGPDSNNPDLYISKVDLLSQCVIFWTKDDSRLVVPFTNANEHNDKIQSFTYIPESQDGTVHVFVGSVSETGDLKLTFEVRPKELVPWTSNGYWKLRPEVHAFYTKQRTTTSSSSFFVDLPIRLMLTDKERGIFTLIASGENLSRDFYSGVEGAMVYVSLTNPNTTLDVSSEPIRLCPFKIETPAEQIIHINGVDFEMVEMRGGTFMMGAQKNDPLGENYDENASEYADPPVQEVTLSDYSIGKYEVTQEQWLAIVGRDLGVADGDPLRPMAQVTPEDVMYTFIPTLNRLLEKETKDVHFVLPTTAQWEYAARGGGNGINYTFSGSTDVNEVAWYQDTALDGKTSPVGQKKPNVLGIYDMSGNVAEICRDANVFGYPSGSLTDPDASHEILHSYSQLATRGGYYEGYANECRVSSQGSIIFSGQPTHHVGFRLALVPNPYNKTVTPLENSRKFTVNGVTFEMVDVEGGIFDMGAQSENPAEPNYDEDALGNECPVHKDTLTAFSIGRLEVTQELWMAVMGDNPSVFQGNYSLPVDNVSWDRIENEFLPKLNSMLRNQLPNGKKFALPTEAQWEYAARGGHLGEGYRYCGSDILNEVAWYGHGEANSTVDRKGSRPVGQKKPSDLSLYDMLGNVAEWCYDTFDDYWHDDYLPEKEDMKVYRGGSWSMYHGACRPAFRKSMNRTKASYDIGFRLVLVSTK